MYRNIRSLCHIPGTNIVLYINYISKTNKQTNKQTHRKRDQICGYQSCAGLGGGRKGDWIKVVKKYKLPGIGSISTRDAMYNMINIIDTAVCYI